MNHLIFSVLFVGIYSFLLSIVLVSAVHKLRQPIPFRHSFINYQLFPEKIAGKLAATVAWVEIALVLMSVALLSLSHFAFSVLLVGIIYAVYLLMILYAALNKRTQLDCGCSLNSSTTELPVRYLLLRNMGLLALAVTNWLIAPIIPGSAAEWILGLATSCSFFVFYNSLEGLVENSVLIKKLKVSYD